MSMLVHYLHYVGHDVSIYSTYDFSRTICEVLSVTVLS